MATNPYEYPLALDVARSALITLPLAQIIRKIRYEIHNHDGLVWSVDRFQGPNSGLVLAEVELAHPDQQIERPSWVGKEVTLDPRYSNSSWRAFLCAASIILLVQRPMQIHLYDWWPLRQRGRIYAKLSHMPVEVIHHGKS